MASTPGVQEMYRLTNPDPLYRFTLRAIATEAGCSKETVRLLRTGKLTETRKDAAEGIARACGVNLAAMFEPCNRRAWN